MHSYTTDETSVVLRVTLKPFFIAYHFFQITVLGRGDIDTESIILVIFTHKRQTCDEKNHRLKKSRISGVFYFGEFYFISRALVRIPSIY